jgi:predicted dehydrogenase
VTLRVGVVGVGFGREVHVPAFRADERCRVVAIGAASAGRAREAAAALGVERAFGDWKDMVTSPDLDVVTVAVPPAVQPTVAEAAARAGKHVFCEKPAGVTIPPVERMVAAAVAARVAHGIDFFFPELDAWRKAKAAVEDGTLGRLRHATLIWHVETFAHRARRDSWKVRHDLGGGTLNNFACHSLHYLEWLFGGIRRLAARLTPAGGAGDARVDAWLEFESRLPVSVSIAADAFLGTGHRLEVYGEDGTLVLANTSPDYAQGFILSVGTRGAPVLAPVATGFPAADRDGRIAAVRSVARRFIDGIASGATTTPNLHDGLRVQVLMAALREADGTGTWTTPPPRRERGDLG